MKARMDFRLEEKTKRLIETAAELKDMTVSGYVNHLIEQCQEKIIDDIAYGFTAKQLIRNVLGEDEEKEMAAIVRDHLVQKLLTDWPDNLNIWGKMVTDWKLLFTDYIKNKKG
jgi:uncharacterized protein YjgD (DUF1641 family)